MPDPPVSKWSRVSLQSRMSKRSRATSRGLQGRDGVTTTEGVPAGQMSLHPIDQEILARIARHDEAALATLYDRYAGLLYSFALRICGEPEAAEEVLQDVFLTVWRSADRWDPERGSAQAWLVTITRHRAIDYLRKKDLKPPLPLHNGAASDEATPDEIAEGRELARDLRRAIEQLPAQFRDVVELVYFSGMTQREAAEALAIPYGTVKSRIRLAVERIARLLNGQGVDV